MPERRLPRTTPPASWRRPAPARSVLVSPSACSAT